MFYFLTYTILQVMHLELTKNIKELGKTWEPVSIILVASQRKQVILSFPRKSLNPIRFLTKQQNLANIRTVKASYTNSTRLSILFAEKTFCLYKRLQESFQFYILPIIHLFWFYTDRLWNLFSALGVFVEIIHFVIFFLLL